MSITNRIVFAVFAAVAATLCVPPAYAGIIGNSIFEGVWRLSPSNHTDSFVDVSYDIGLVQVAGIGWDGTPTINPDYLGPPTAFSAVYVDHFGFQFSLVSADIILGADKSMMITSSKGGSLLVPAHPPYHLFPIDDAHENITFSGPEWTDVDWILFSYAGPDSGVPEIGFDQIVGSIPEPASLAILGLGLAGLGFIRRRRAP